MTLVKFKLYERKADIGIKLGHQVKEVGWGFTEKELT